MTSENLVILANRGFDISDGLLENVSIVFRPLRRGSNQFTMAESVSTKVVANACIHIESVIRRMKVFRIL